jgi:hypothetical protein
MGGKAGQFSFLLDLFENSRRLGSVSLQASEEDL